MHSFFFLVRRTLWLASALVIVAVVIVLISLAITFKLWRTAEVPTEPNRIQLAEPFGVSPIRVLIATDAAAITQRGPVTFSVITSFRVSVIALLFHRLYGGDVKSVPCVRNVKTSGLCIGASNCATLRGHT